MSRTTPVARHSIQVSIDARASVSTGISALDRAQTILAAIDPKPQPDDLARRAMFSRFAPRRRRAGARRTDRGFGRYGAAWPGLSPASVICEIMNDDGTMARVPELVLLQEAQAGDDHRFGTGALPNGFG